MMLGPQYGEDAGPESKSSAKEMPSPLSKTSAPSVNAVFTAAAKPGLESEFILRCLRGDKSVADARRLEQLLECNLDWSSVLAMARSHAVLPLLHQELSSLCLSGVPPGARSELENLFRDNAVRNLGMAAELTEIIRICNNNSISVVPFKGVVLAHRLYGNFALRVTHDLDLLVHQRDAQKLRELLALRGYEPNWTLRDWYTDEMLRTLRQLPLVNKNQLWMVEVHTALLDGPDSQATTLEALNSRLEIIEISRLNISVLPIDELVLYLCVHGSKHCWNRLGWICDVAQLVRLHPNLNWSAILLRARQRNWERSFLVGLALAWELLGVTLPEEMAFRQPAIQSLAKSVAAKLFAPRRVQNRTLWRLWFQLRSRERLRDRWWFAWSTVMRPTVADWQSFSLPAPLSPLYYLFRPIRLVRKYAVRLFGGLLAATVAPKDKTEPTSVRSSDK